MKTTASNLRNLKKGVAVRILPIIIRFALGNAVCNFIKKPQKVSHTLLILQIC